MTVLETLLARNAEFAAHRFTQNLPFQARLQTMVLSCLDPRVHPGAYSGSRTRRCCRDPQRWRTDYTRDLAENMALLQTLLRVEGTNLTSGLNLVASTPHRLRHHPPRRETRLARGLFRH